MEETQTTYSYSLKALGEAIKVEAEKEGLKVAEEALEKLGKSVYLGFKQWLILSAATSENKIDDIVMPLIHTVDGIVLPQIEKLDLDGSGN